MTRLVPLILAIALAASGCTRKAAPPAKAPAEPAAKAAPTRAPAATATAKAQKAGATAEAQKAGATAETGKAAGEAPDAGLPPKKPWPKGQPRIDAPVKDFTLKDPAGHPHGLFASMGKHGAVVVFVSTHCPYSTAYDRLLGRLARRYRKHGIRFLAIDANTNETPKAIAAWHRKAHLPFPVLVDAQGEVAKALGARGTPDAYLIGADHLLRYHGGIGNSFPPVTDPHRADATSLEPALKDHLRGKRPANPIIHSFGCPLHR